MNSWATTLSPRAPGENTHGRILLESSSGGSLGRAPASWGLRIGDRGLRIGRLDLRNPQSGLCNPASGSSWTALGKRPDWRITSPHAPSPNGHRPACTSSMCRCPSYPAGSDRRKPTTGSIAWCWRHACFPMEDAARAIANFEDDTERDARVVPTPIDAGMHRHRAVGRGDRRPPRSAATTRDEQNQQRESDGFPHADLHHPTPEFRRAAAMLRQESTLELTTLMMRSIPRGTRKITIEVCPELGRMRPASLWTVPPRVATRRLRKYS